MSPQSFMALSKLQSMLQDADVFDVDPQTGFMPSHVPLVRLPAEWEPWEKTLDDAIGAKLQTGDKQGLSIEEKAASEAWRSHVRQMHQLPTQGLEVSAPLLRRAHLVLTYIMHFYIQSLPIDAQVIIPRSIAIPVVRISATLNIPPLLTYSDTVLYNWIIDPSSKEERPTVHNIRSNTMFSGTTDEQEFYLCSARIELRGVEALELMRATMDEIFIGDETAVRRLTGYLHTMAEVINDMKTLLMDVRKECRPGAYYNNVRPWFRGQDSSTQKRPWIFEGLDEDPSLKVPTELSGPSAGQSSIIHVLDLFLGVDHESAATPGKPSFMSRMQIYMPYNHRMFLDHLATNQRPLRAFVAGSQDQALHEAFNKAVLALKEFRDSHMIIATLYILGPARKAAQTTALEERKTQSAVELPTTSDALRPDLSSRASVASMDYGSLKGTGGTNLVRFLKSTRDRTKETILPS